MDDKKTIILDALNSLNEQTKGDSVDWTVIQLYDAIVYMNDTIEALELRDVVDVIDGWIWSKTKRP
jgi:hypothetical protein